MTAPPPIRIPCEGSHCPGHVIAGDNIICSMCGRITPPVHAEGYGAVCAPHDRDDIISMLQRGDFDA
jgi:hypothetical protein